MHKALIGDLGAGKVELLQVGQPFQVHQSSVGDPPIRERPESGGWFQGCEVVLQPQVGHRLTGNAQAIQF